jgi:hypothetical protein
MGFDNRVVSPGGTGSVDEFWQATGLYATPLVLGLLVVWIVWWLGAVNWQRAWPVLAGGAWVPLLLLMFVAALVWSRLDPLPVLNFWAHLLGVGLLVGLALFCGWVQGVMHWTPAEVELEPEPVVEPGHAPVPHEEPGPAHPHH